MSVELEFGSGEIIVCLVGRDGATRSELDLSVGGTSTLRAKTQLPLTLQTTDGEVAVVPVVFSCSDPEQVVLIDDQKPEKFIARRCKEMGCSAKVTSDAVRGRARRLELALSLGPVTPSNSAGRPATKAAK